MDEPSADMSATPCATAEPRRQRAATALRVQGAPAMSRGLQSADEFGLNFPIPEDGLAGVTSVPCIVKLYDRDIDAIHLCDAVEFVGVLCVNPEIASFDGREERMFWDARNPSASLVPRLHVLALRQLPFHHPLMPFTPSWLSEARLAGAWQRQFSAPGAIAELRSLALEALTPYVGGDAVAAQYILMLLVSRSFAKHGDEPLGSWSLNLGCWPEGLDVRQFSRALSEFVPRVAHHEVTAASLNTGRWRPRKDFDANRLVAGRLQVASGTVMIFDETKLTPGQLNDSGVRNLAAIRSLLVDRVLTCDFMSCDVKMPLELQIVHVSSSKSVIPEHDVLLPLRPCESQPRTLQPEALNAIRLFLGLVTRSPRPLDIPDNVVHKFSEDFAAVRQNGGINSSLCSTWIGLARALCLIHGEQALSLERWQGMLTLETERLRRCKENGFLQQV